jgi:hypothetical protein
MNALKKSSVASGASTKATVHRAPGVSTLPATGKAPNYTI